MSYSSLPNKKLRCYKDARYSPKEEKRKIVTMSDVFLGHSLYNS
jgi:hypothetical protein